MEFVPAKVTCQHWVTAQNALLESGIVPALLWGETHEKQILKGI